MGPLDLELSKYTFYFFYVKSDGFSFSETYSATLQGFIHHFNHTLSHLSSMALLSGSCQDSPCPNTYANTCTCINIYRVSYTQPCCSPQIQPAPGDSCHESFWGSAVGQTGLWDEPCEWRGVKRRGKQAYK